MTQTRSKAAETLSLMVSRPPSLQYAALCYRKAKKGIEVLLITSRGSGRWIMPKGWAMKNETDYGTAAQEAREEAGVVGDVEQEAIGSYRYRKLLPEGLPIDCTVNVYALEVERLEDEYLEKGERQRRWFSQDEAARKVGEPELQLLLKEYTP
jgi:8-oxo-dGTP pyrophosphatase MutT (NUDIX family)